MRLVGDDDNVVAVRQDRHVGAGFCLELVDQGEHVPVVLRQQLAQVRRRVSLDVAASDRPGRLKRPVELVVEFDSVGDHHERRTAGPLAEHLLGEEQHREALTGPSGVPEHAEAPLEFFEAVVGAHGVGDAEVLVVLGDRLDQTAAFFDERRVVLDDVEKAATGSDRVEGDREGQFAFFVFGVDLAPLAEVPPRGVGGTDLGFRAVGQQHQAVEPEQLRDRCPVVGDVDRVGRLASDLRSLQFDEQQRDAVDEADDVESLSALFLAR